MLKLEIQMDNIDEMVANGQKIKAREKLETLHSTFTDIEADQKVLLAIDEDADLEGIQMPQLKALMQRYNKTMAQLKNGLTIFIDCQAELFGDNYPTLANTIKGGHTHNYTEAARDGYKQITPQLIELINQYIKQ